MTDFNRSAREASNAALDRILLYAKGLGLSPEQSLETALETFRSAGGSGVVLQPDEVMERFREILIGLNLHPDQLIEANTFPACAPPLNKRHMLAEEMELSVIKSLMRLCGMSSARP